MQDSITQAVNNSEDDYIDDVLRDAWASPNASHWANPDRGRFSGGHGSIGMAVGGKGVHVWPE